MMKLISKIVQICSWFVYMIIIAVLLLIAPIVIGDMPVRILSGSMEPAYPVGSITYYHQNANFEDFAVGDAVTFLFGDGGSLATHRIIAIDESSRSFTTKGDSNNSQDASQLPFERVKGKTASFAIPYAGFLVAFFQKWYVIASMAVIFILNFLLGGDNNKSREKPEISERPEVFRDAWDKKLKILHGTPKAPATAPAKSSKKNKAVFGRGKKKNISAEEFFSDF